jgi:hypothetical protein
MVEKWLHFFKKPEKEETAAQPEEGKKQESETYV